ncbi:DUF4870 family protein [Qipengyuania polymorpha]|uniref:DUF4870 family protein n=1 Tax=Qipengyuania polymorpha TaxID=2867234 RepID=UPI001FFC6333|nr:hypothetical protein [Qipengyuania polymorpha]
MDNSQQSRESGRIDVGADREGFGTQPPARSSNASGVDSNRPVIVGALYLASFLTGITGLVGVVLAHIWEGEARGTWAESHYTYLIRTFWFSFLASIAAVVLMFVIIGFFLFPLIAIWFGVRSVLSLVKASKQEPMPDPKTLLF